MLTQIVFAIFAISILGLIFVLARKIPALLALPKNGHHGIKKHRVIVKLEKKIKDKYFHFVEKQMLLHRLLSKSRIVILKIERWIDVALHGIRKKAQELDKRKK